MFASLRTGNQRRDAKRALAVIAMALAATPAHAQLERFNARLTDVQTGLIGLGAIIFTIAFLWVAYKMAFDHAKWAEVSRVAFAGIIAGAASPLSIWILG